jgi:hypothetical protein
MLFLALPSNVNRFTTKGHPALSFQTAWTCITKSLSLEKVLVLGGWKYAQQRDSKL